MAGAVAIPDTVVELNDVIEGVTELDKAVDAAFATASTVNGVEEHAGVSVALQTPVEAAVEPVPQAILLPVVHGEAGAAAVIAAPTNASVAIFVVASPAVCVGAVGEPVSAGLESGASPTTAVDPNNLPPGSQPI